MPQHLQVGSTAGGDISGTFPNPILTTTAVTAGSYTGADITVDAKGRITSAANGSSGGTVTTVSVVSANGVSGSVTNASTTPMISLLLGAITPSSVTTGPISVTGVSDTNQVVIKGFSTQTNNLLRLLTSSNTLVFSIDMAGQVRSGNVVPLANTTYNSGSSSNYWANMYSSRHYLNSTAYFDGSTAGVLAATGNISATNLSGTNTGDQTNITGTAGNVTGIVATANGGTGQTSLTNLPLITPAISGATNISGTLAVTNNNSVTATVPSVLATVTGINGKTVANTTLFTVPTGKTAVITGYNVRVSAASAITVGPAAGIGNVSGTNNISASQAMNPLTGTTTIFQWTINGMSLITAAAGVIYFNLGTAATGTSETLTVDVYGYLV